MKFCSLAVLAMCASPALADEPSPPVRELLVDPHALAGWLADRDPMLDAARAKVEAASALHRQAQVYPNPQLQLGFGGFVIGGGNVPQPPETMSGPTGVTQTTNVTIGVGELFEIGKRGPREAAANLRMREAGESGVATLGGRITDATTTLGKLAYVSARHAAVQTNLDEARKLQALEKVRLDNKDLSAAEFERIELDTEELEIQLGRASADLAVATAGCSAALFARCNADGLDVAALDAAAPLPAQLPAAATAVASRPTHRAEELEGNALDQDARLADKRKIPDPTIALDYTFDNYQYSGSAPNTVGISLSIPLPFFDRGNHDAAAARANKRASQAQARAEMIAETSQADALAAQQTALAAVLARLEKEAVPRSELIVAQTRKAFDVGHASLADLLLAERTHRDLLLEVLDARFDLFNVRVQLRQALGLDDEAARAPLGRK